MINYYNENDPNAAAWLRELIKGGHIANGIVDERSIKDVQPNDLTDFTQCHFFAGIGGWSYALRLAGWPDDRPVWTGSCPCQPFSDAGQKGGTEDKRHLWPEFYRLISECRPSAIFGEQVASKDGLAWLDIVSADLESADYAVGAADLCAAGVEAPHIRQRLYFVADSSSARLAGRALEPARQKLAPAERSGNAGELGNADVRGRTPGDEATPANGYGRTAISASVWAECDWLPCIDGKARPVEPGTFPLFNGISEQLVRLGALEMAGWKEVEMHGSTYQRDADEILRVLQNSVRSETDKRPAGGLRDIHAASLLSDFLLCVDAARYGAAIGGSLKEARAQAYRRIVRGVRDGGEFGGAPRQRRSDEQLPGEPADAMLRLSLILARYAEAHQEVARDAHAASGRVNMLRGYGNAIVPQVAAEFVRATMDSGHGC